MFDLDGAINSWRERLNRQTGISKIDQEEMEADLREEIEECIKSGLAPREAYFKAVRHFGNEETVAQSLRAVNWQENYARWMQAQPALLANYFKIAWRNLYKHKTYASINIFGLVVGITSFIIIMLYVRDEFSYDQFHTHANRIHRIVVDHIETNGTKSPRIATPGALTEAIKRLIPDIEHATYLHTASWGKALLSNENHTFFGQNFLYVNDSFFDVFSFPLIHGNTKSALTDPASVVLTESMAKKFFGTNKALGQTLTFNQFKQDVSLKVSGVIKDVPTQSHLKFDFLIPSLLVRPEWANNWGQGHTYTYIKVKPQAALTEVNAKIQHLMDTHHLKKDIQVIAYTQPLTGINGIHLAPPRLWEMHPGGNQQHLQTLILVAFFILLIAGINYINLATARSAMRAKEIGMRKVVGAFRKTLIYQFLNESILLSLIAGLIAVSLTEMILPLFNNLMQKELSLFTAGNQFVWLGITTAVLLFGLTAGLYPAFYLSAFKPISIFSKQRTTKRARFDLRKTLVVSQFALSAFLIIGMIVVQKQMTHIRSTNLGFDKDQIIVIRNFHRTPNRDRNFVVRNTLKTIPGVLKVGGGLGNNIGLRGATYGGGIRLKDTNQDPVGYHAQLVSGGYLDVFDLEFITGRNFSPEFPSELKNGIVINETAVKKLGIQGSPLGQTIITHTNAEKTIIGVVKDFHTASLHHEIAPLIFLYNNMGWEGVIKLSGGQIQETLAQIQETWAKFVPDTPMDYYFIDEAINNLYRTEQNFHTLFSIMTGLTLIIACLGLFGLAAFTAEQRTKEIGIRKVLGATTPNVVGLLSKEFVKLVTIANIIAWPIAYVVMNNWLTNFAYRITFGIEIFALSGALALSIALITVCTQTFKAARSNPIDALRTE